MIQEYTLREDVTILAEKLEASGMVTHRRGITNVPEGDYLIHNLDGSVTPTKAEEFEAMYRLKEIPEEVTEDVKPVRRRKSS